MNHRGHPRPDEYPAFENSYISRVAPGDLLKILDTQIDKTLVLLQSVSEEKSNYAYAPGKWTIKEVIGHISDTERIMAYRALRIARGDLTPLPGYDQNAYVPIANFGERTLQSVADEFRSVRHATVTLFTGLPAEAWMRQGTANGLEHTVRAIGYMIAGHELHHLDILKNRYLTIPDTEK